MFRAGTTLLSRLFDQDPRNRALLMWEAGDSVPPPTPADHRTGPRVDAVHASNAMLAEINPQIEVVHHEQADEATECITVMGQDFKSLTYEAIANVPGYDEWLLGVDQRSAYEYHRSVLQVLQSGGVRGRWTLKSPHHAIALEHLTAVYPDARLVLLHRDPVVLERVGVQPDQHAVVDVHRRRPPRVHRVALAGDARGVGAPHRGVPRRASRSTRSSTCSTPTSSPIRRARSRRSTAPSATSSTTPAPRRSPPTSTPTRGASSAPTSTTCPQYGLDAGELAERFAGYTDRYAVPREHSTSLGWFA